MSTPELALGTVQFGIAYGIAGVAAPVTDAHAREILARAWDFGIRRLDTAPGYGDIESRLRAMIGNRDFSIVSKVPAIPVGGNRADHVRRSVETSRMRLGPQLKGLLFHSGDDLGGADAEQLWAAAECGVPLGLSCYDASVLQAAAERFPVAMAQLPGNALDQQVAHLRPSQPVEITLRSIFLQGLLVMPAASAAARVPAAADAVNRFHRFCRESRLSPLAAALGLARGLKNVDYCVVGVDSVAQLEEVAEAWQTGPVLSAPELDTRAGDVIDPRRWSPVPSV